MERPIERPMGVTIIALLAFFGGFFGMCLPILSFIGSAQFGGILGSISAMVGTFLLVGPVLQIIFAVGAFGLKRWAWYLGLIASVISVSGVILSLFEGATFPVIINSLVSVIILIYLLTPKVREAFGI